MKWVWTWVEMLETGGEADEDYLTLDDAATTAAEDGAFHHIKQVTLVTLVSHQAE